MELASVTLSPASQYVKNYVDFVWSCHIPVLLHLTGSVLDEGAPFGISKLRSIRAVKGWPVAVAASLLSRLCACLPFGVFFMKAYYVCMCMCDVLRLLRVLICIFPVFPS
jgi:hypothetical protein